LCSRGARRDIWVFERLEIGNDLTFLGFLTVVTSGETQLKLAQEKKSTKGKMKAERRSIWRCEVDVCFRGRKSTCPRIIERPVREKTERMGVLGKLEVRDG